MAGVWKIPSDQNVSDEAGEQNIITNGNGGQNTENETQVAKDAQNVLTFKNSSWYSDHDYTGTFLFPVSNLWTII